MSEQNKINNTKDLKRDNTVFKEISEFLGKDFLKQSYIFEGFVFNVCMKGKLKIKINYKEYLITSGDMFVILPKHVFTILEHSSDLDVKTVFISLDFIQNIPTSPNFYLLKNIETCPDVKMTEEQQEDFIKIFTLIEKYDNKSILNKQIQDALTLSLILIATSLFDNIQMNKKVPYSRQEDLTRCFFEILLRHYETERNVFFYADKLCITPKYLTTAVKSVTNHSVQSWINEVVLIEAKRYLNTSILTIQQISEKLHFPTSSSFIRFFRTHVGCTPLCYRKNNET